MVKKLAETRCQDPDTYIVDVPHNYTIIKITGVKDYFDIGQHYVISIERCKVCKEVRVLEYNTHNWYEHK